MILVQSLSEYTFEGDVIKKLRLTAPSYMALRTKCLFLDFNQLFHNKSSLTFT